MPSGAKKRKAAKKKKANDSSPLNSLHGENASPENQDLVTGGETLEVVKREDTSSENKSVTIEKDEGNIEIDTGSKSKKSNESSSSSGSSSSDDEFNVVEKKVVVLESVPAAIESLPEKITQEVEEFKGSAIVDPVKPFDSSLEVLKEAKNDEKKEDTVVVDEIVSKDDCSTSSVVESVSKENGAVELPLSDGKVSSEPKDYETLPTTQNVSVSGDNGVDCVIESETIEYTDRQPLVASMPVAVQKTTSWKGCCGILDLFSGSDRN